jgi:hypothetical protein
LHVYSIACVIGGVLIERVVAKVFPSFFLMIYLRLKRFGSSNHGMVARSKTPGFALGSGMITRLMLFRSNKKLSGDLKIN